MNYATLKSYKVRELVQFLLRCLLCNYMDVFACKPKFLLTSCVVIRLHVYTNVDLAYLTMLVCPQEKVLCKNAMPYVTVYIFVTITVITVGVNTVTVALTSKSNIAVHVNKAYKGRRGVAPPILNRGTG